MTGTYDGPAQRPTRASRQPWRALVAAGPHKARTVWIAGAGVVMVFGFGVLVRSSRFDFAVVHWLNGHHHGVLGTVANAVYSAFGPAPAILGTAMLTGIIAIVTRDVRVASTFAVTIAATWLSLAIVKLVVHRPRPDASLLPFPFHPTQTDASFPSGHAAFVTTVVVTIVLGLEAGHRRWIAGIIGAGVVLGVSTALVIDGVHYPSDVIASILWGLVVTPLSRMVWVEILLLGSRRRTRPPRP